jgi:hypothetical protein
VDMDFDLLAGALRADRGDSATYLEVLAGKLAQALPGSVGVRRAGGLLRGGRVRELTVDLGEERFVLAAPVPGRLEARRSRVVRGIVIASQPLAVADWVDALAQALLREAGRSEATRQALERLLG